MGRTRQSEAAVAAALGLDDLTMAELNQNVLEERRGMSCAWAI
jgi:hypothetical protein